MLQQRRPRRRKVVDGRLQYGMIAVFLTVIVAGLLLFAAVVAVFLFITGEGDAAAQAAFLRSVLPWLLLNDLAIMIVAIVTGIIATHRIAGPIYRIESDIDRALAGEAGVTIRLRRTDAFPALARKVNQLLEHLDRSRAD
jgi:methyl-accepting chemotaxis protein